MQRIIQACNITNAETVCEAGTGMGVLTEKLCRAAGRVVSYEVDKNLFGRAKSTIRLEENLELVNRDLFRERDPTLEFDVFVSNLPYSRSRDAFEWLATRNFGRAIVMVQKEFAEKLQARPGEKNYRAITAIVSYCFVVEQLFDVDRKAFRPMPKVASTVLRITPVRQITQKQVKNVNLVFSKRNKKASAVASRMNIDSDFGHRRVFQLEPAEIMVLAK